MATTHTNPNFGPLDQFYTRPETAAACIAYLKTVLPELAPALYLEPSAGDGAFLTQMPQPRIGIDIAPANPEVATADFLTWMPSESLGNIVVVGNPPFGRNAALAIQFFNHASVFADVIAMIMPASLMKGSMQNRLNAKFGLVSELPLPAELFRVDGQLHPVNTVFQIWKRSDVLRPKAIATTTHADFTFVKNVQEADFVVRRVGGRAGDILTVPTPGKVVPTGYASTSNLFIKACGIDPVRLETRFRNMDFSGVRCCTAAIPSVSKGEIVTLYNALLAFETTTTTRKLATQASASNADAVRPRCPMFTVSELHGRTLKQYFKTMLSTPETAMPGDIIAVSCSGLVFDTGWMTAEMTFLVKTISGITQRRLYELPFDQKEEAAECVGLIENDWEIVGEFPEECYCPDDAGPRRFEIIHCRNALLLLWLEQYRQFNHPPTLFADAEVPAALLIEEDDLTGSGALSAERLNGIISLMEKVGFLEVASPIMAAYS